jgi:hypothetical protein
LRLLQRLRGGPMKEIRPAEDIDVGRVLHAAGCVSLKSSGCLPP